MLFLSFIYLNLHSEEKSNSANIENIHDTIINKKDNQSTHDSYAENVHMYICIQALHLLKDKFPNINFSVLENRIGTMNDCGTRQWQVGKITTGACREDLEDVVFDIRGPFGFYTSASHFWNADNRTNGDHSLTTLNIFETNIDFPNSFTKLMRFIDGQWFAWRNGGYHERRYVEYLHDDGVYHRFSYHTRGLIDFYKTKRIWHYSYINTLGQEIYVNEEITLSDVVFNRIIWEVLGRMAHHIGDNSVGSHTHNDVHASIFGGDCYHDYIDNGAYLNYTWLTAKNAGGFINPYESSDDPIRYLLYTTNQIADHYPSGPDCLEIPQQHLGDNNLPGGSNPMILQYYQQLGPTPPNITDLSSEGSYCFNHAIRATAGLFYWFAVETGIINTDPLAFPKITGFSFNSNDYNLYHGEGKTLTCNATGSNLQYSFRLRACRTDMECYAPIPGIVTQIVDNKFKIINTAFRNYFTCDSYDSLCGRPGGSSAYPPPVNFYIEARVSNQFGQDTKIFDINNPHLIYPNERLRPPITGGCPYVAVKGTDEFIYVNNILNESEFINNIGKDIQDKLILTEAPYINEEDKLITIAINEAGIDTDSFDKLELFAIDHPENTILGITESNDLVLYSEDEINSPKSAVISGTVVTDILRYDSSFTNTVKGLEKDKLYLEFGNSPSDQLNLSKKEYSDSIAIILDSYAHEFDVSNINTKDNAGYITAYDDNGNSNTNLIEFSKRELRSANIIPVFKDKSIKRVEADWKHEFQLTYFSTVTVYFGGFDKIELELINAENSITGDIKKIVSQADKRYAEIDSNSYITLQFKAHGEEVKAGMKRDYVLCAEGRSYKKNWNYGNGLSNNSELENESDTTADSFRLFDNYPNPFNPSTVIKYHLPEVNFVSLKIYDVLGNEVKTLVNDKQSKGNYSVSFDGSDLPSGIYFYKLKTDNFTEVKKMILLK